MSNVNVVTCILSFRKGKSNTITFCKLEPVSEYVCWNSAGRGCLTGNFFVFERNFFTKCNFVSAHVTSLYTSSYDSACHWVYVGLKIFSENFEISLDFSESYGKLYFMIRNTEK
jgi:hypothetical protein